MNKYLNEAIVILEQLSKINEQILSVGCSYEMNLQINDVILDIQLLFYNYDVNLPLYKLAMQLNDKIERQKQPGNCYDETDVEYLVYLINKFINVLKFRCQNDA